jgi:RNA polymerase sigma-70 factor, ECF subfamily
LPHVDAAFNLARWLLRDRSNAEDVTQEALLRAFRSFSGFRAGDARAWLLQIVRNCCYTWLKGNRPHEDVSEVEEDALASGEPSPEVLAIASYDRERIVRALEALPMHFREILVLRELEGCSYKEIAAITAYPIGTVMSALARARRQLRAALSEPRQKESSHAL